MHTYSYNSIHLNLGLGTWIALCVELLPLYVCLVGLRSDTVVVLKVSDMINNSVL